MMNFPHSEVLQNWQQSIGNVVHWEIAHDKQTVFYITTDTGKRLVLKQILHQPSVDRLQSEYDVLRYLKSHAIPVSVPLLTDIGQHYINVDGQIYTLSPNISPANPKVWVNDKNRYLQIGNALAQFHKALATYPKTIPSWTMNLPQKLEDEIFPFLNDNVPQHHVTKLMQQIKPIQSKMYALWSRLPTQYIHGDCHGGNVLFDGEDVCGFIDLDHLPIGTRIYDIAYFLADEVKNRINEPDKLIHWLDAFGNIITGYEGLLRLTRQEKDAIWYGMLITQLLFIHWFAKNGNSEHKRKNLNVFDWIYTQQVRIVSATS